MTTLEEAIAARDKYLEDKPHLQGYQDELNAILDKVPEDQRTEVVFLLIAEKLQQLQLEQARLLKELHDAETD